jgi:hypothetical protein
MPLPKAKKYSAIMKTNDVFDIKRFSLLLRQNMIHHYRIIMTSVIAVSGGLFILLMLNQLANRYRPWQYQQFIGLFIAMFIILGILYVGTAFPGIRSKEKSYSFLLLPASTFEKYAFEFINRIILFIIALPMIYWLVFFLEGNFMRLMHPGFEFQSFWFFNERFPALNSAGPDHGWIILIFINLGLMIFIIPFTGATSFMKYPILKTILALAIVFFFHLFLVFFLMKVLGFKDHMVNKSPEFLFMSTREQVVRFAGIYTTLINLGLIAASFFKLKEREA